MKAPSSENCDNNASEDEGADTFVLDYEDFFSVLMYYGHMSYDEIMERSRLFLYGIYRQYGKRACENLGVSSDKEKEEGFEKGPLEDSDYPSTFKRLTPRERKEAAAEFKDTEDFMRQFGGFSANQLDKSISVEKH